MTPSNDTPERERFDELSARTSMEACPHCEPAGRIFHEIGKPCPGQSRNTPAAPVGSQEQRKVSDYDIWYQPCAHCGFDTGKSSTEQTRCWKCGRNIHRDFSERALKKL